MRPSRLPASLLSLLLWLVPALAGATTWNEPSHPDVIRQADTFGLFEVEAVTPDAVRLKTIRSLAGIATGTIELDARRWSQLELTSTSSAAGDLSGEFVEQFAPGTRAYLHLHRDGARWLLPTPSAGISGIQADGLVAAAYRNSYEKALQPAAAYERVQACLFRHLHGEPCDTAALAADLAAPLAQPVAAISATATPEETARFFSQHVALESAYMLGTDVPLATLEPFLAHDFFHVQRSAVRALRASHDPGRDARLLAFIADGTRDANARVIAVMMAREIADPALTRKIKALRLAKDAEASLPFESIMDPRVGTLFPSSVQAAIDWL